MPKINPKYHKYILDKRNHLLSNYALICEFDNVVLKHNSNNPYYTSTNTASSSDWIKAFESAGGIKVIDPFRGKLQLFWKVQGGPNNHSEVKPFYFHDGDDNEDTGFGLPNQIDNGIRPLTQGDALPETRNINPEWPLWPPSGR